MNADPNAVAAQFFMVYMRNPMQFTRYGSTRFARRDSCIDATWSCALHEMRSVAACAAYAVLSYVVTPCEFTRFMRYGLMPLRGTLVHAVVLMRFARGGFDVHAEWIDAIYACGFTRCSYAVHSYGAVMRFFPKKSWSSVHSSFYFPLLPHSNPFFYFLNASLVPCSFGLWEIGAKVGPQLKVAGPHPSWGAFPPHTSTLTMFWIHPRHIFGSELMIYSVTLAMSRAIYSHMPCSVSFALPRLWACG
jgi:hypothetical protein